MVFRSKGAAVAAAAAVAVGAGAWAWSARSGSAPAFDRRADQNVLLVTIDTLRADALGSYGGSTRTPNLDALAARGTRFDFAHAHAVLTRPSHASILTGLYPYEHGVRDHSGYRMKPGTPTVATMLKRSGFATGAFVGGVPLERRFGLDEGFDVYDDRFGRTGNASDFTMAERPAGEVVEVALKWIGAQQGRWFAWVHVFDPHAPYTPPPPFDTEYAGRAYYGEVAYVDSAVGPLFKAAGSAARPTVVVVTAQPDAPDPTSADFALTIPAQTMATDRDSASVLAMGTAFELAMAIFFDLAVIRIQALRGETLESMRERHFNLE